MNKLTVIIPFLNEGAEVENTLQSIRQMIGNQVNILLIDDASSDQYDYKAAALKYNASLYTHDVRQGVAASRDEAIAMCPTDSFLLLDAHMRFYQTDWVDKVLAELEKDTHTLLCCQTIPLIKNESGEVCFITGRNTSFGAYIDFSPKGNLQVRWNYCDPDSESQVVQIPCLLGAGYAANKSYWQYLKGLNGLKGYGMDEQLLSMKVWLEGGQCKLLKQVGIGHVYRTEAPYNAVDLCFAYNKLYIAELVLPYSYKLEIFNELKEMDPLVLKEAMQLLLSDKHELIEIQKHLQKIARRSIYSFIEYNKQIHNQHTNT